VLGDVTPNVTGRNDKLQLDPQGTGAGEVECGRWHSGFTMGSAKRSEGAEGGWKEGAYSDLKR
jgi:hypothetical protein